MAGLPTNQRDQIMLVVGILGIIGAGAYWNWVYTPKEALLDVTRAHVAQLDASNQAARASIAGGSIEELKAEAKRLQDNLTQMRTLIPASNEVPALVDQIIGAARRTGLEFGNFNPGGNVQGEQFDTQRYRMSFEGNYHQIGSLLAEIGSLRRIVVPVNLSLAVVAGTRVRNAPVNERLLRAQFDVQTYVVRTSSGGTP